MRCHEPSLIYSRGMLSNYSNASRLLSKIGPAAPPAELRGRPAAARWALRADFPIDVPSFVYSAVQLHSRRYECEFSISTKERFFHP
jgi:hypothetical protein